MTCTCRTNPTKSASSDLYKCNATRRRNVSGGLESRLILSALTAGWTFEPTAPQCPRGSGHPRQCAATRVADATCSMRTANPVRVFELDDLHMLVGPDRAARLLEVGVATAEGVEFVVHAMPARDKFLRCNAVQFGRSG